MRNEVKHLAREWEVCSASQPGGIITQSSALALHERVESNP